MRGHLVLRIALSLTVLDVGTAVWDSSATWAQTPTVGVHAPQGAVASRPTGIAPTGILPTTSVSVRPTTMPTPPPVAMDAPRSFGATIPAPWQTSQVPGPASSVVSPVEQLAADPFQFRVPEGSGSMVPVDVDLPAGIRVLGMLVMESGDSLAALELPGEEEVAYVRAEDDLQIRADGKVATSARRPAGQSAAAPAAAQATGGVLYLKIKEITADHVVVYPQQSPTNVHVFR